MESVGDRCLGAEASLSSAFEKGASDSLSITNVCKFGVWTIPGFLSAEECQEVIRRTEELGYEDAPVTTSSGPVMMKDYRDNLRVMVQDQQSADILFTRIQPYVPLVVAGMVAVGLNERFRYYKYGPGMYFKEHYDGAYLKSRQEFSQITLLVNINEGYEGGETAFYDSRLPGGKYLNKAQAGKAVLFLHRGWLHEGMLLEQGTKYLLRSDVMYRTPPQDQLQTFVGQSCGYCGGAVSIVARDCGHSQLACGCVFPGRYCIYC